MNNPISIVEVIQLMLAPGLMISACALLLLGMNNKYSLVVNRIRLLNEERRRSTRQITGRAPEAEENIRWESINIQLNKLTERVKFVRDAVLSYTYGIACFVITSLLIGMAYIFEFQNLSFIITLFFLFGMVLVLIGVSFAAYETKKGYDIIQLEVKIDE